MYVITISVLVADVGTSLRQDVESTMDAVRGGLAEWVEPEQGAVGDPLPRRTGHRRADHRQQLRECRPAHRPYLPTIREILIEEATDAPHS